jgi:hypothetical protein
MTNRQLANKVRRHRGKVEVPVLIPEDVHHLYVEKADLIEYLMVFPDDQAPFYIVETDHGPMRLDVNS